MYAVSRSIAVALAVGLAGLGLAAKAVQVPVQVSSTLAQDPSVSPDGNFIACDIPGAAGIGIVAAQGGPITPISATGREPSWHPSTSLIVFRAGASLYTVDAFDAVLPVLFVNSSAFDDNPAWSPLGNEIAAQATDEFLVFIAHPAGFITTVGCVDPDVSICEGEGPTWSPNASELAFEDGKQILRVPRSGGTAQEVYSAPIDLSDPAWSPDGKWIAFTQVDLMFPNEETHIWLVDARGPAFGLKQQTAGPFLDADPAWSPDSTTLYFASNRSGETCIWKLAVEVPVRAESSTWGALKAAIERRQ